MSTKWEQLAERIEHLARDEVNDWHTIEQLREAAIAAERQGEESIHPIKSYLCAFDRHKRCRAERELGKQERCECECHTSSQGERVVLDPVGEPSIPRQEIRRAVREQQGER